MKAFRKWWDNHRASASPHTCQSARGENLAMLADEEVWQAAVEWVVGLLEKDPNGYFKIKKELDVD